MTIDKSGQWWKGDLAADLDTYLAEYTKSYYPADRFEHPRCTCGHDRFRIEVDDDEGCARRTCSSCGATALMLDSAESSSDASFEPQACVCGEKEFDLAVAFSHRSSGSIRWITLGGRCTKCGVLGAFTGWKIDYEPSAHLYSAL